MSTKLVILLVVLTLTPVFATAQSDFNQFFARFRAAVVRNDRAAVKSMMASRFEWALDGYISRDEAWRHFNREKRNWLGLKQAVNKRPKACANPYCNNRSGYHIWSSRKYSIEVMFEKIGGQWRWSALLGD